MVGGAAPGSACKHVVYKEVERSNRVRNCVAVVDVVVGCVQSSPYMRSYVKRPRDSRVRTALGLANELMPSGRKIYIPISTQQPRECCVTKNSLITIPLITA